MFFKKQPWKLNTDEYFGVDTPMIFTSENAKVDYAGKIVFLKTNKEISEKLIAGHFVRWDEFLFEKQALLFAERNPIRLDKNDALLLYKMPADIKLLSAASQDYSDFFKWKKDQPGNNLKNLLATYGGYHGLLDFQGDATTIRLFDEDIFMQGQVYPVERQRLVKQAILQKHPVPDSVLKDVFQDSYSTTIEKEYTEGTGDAAMLASISSQSWAFLDMWENTEKGKPVFVYVSQDDSETLLYVVTDFDELGNKKYHLSLDLNSAMNFAVKDQSQMLLILDDQEFAEHIDYQWVDEEHGVKM